MAFRTLNSEDRIAVGIGMIGYDRGWIRDGKYRRQNNQLEGYLRFHRGAAFDGRANRKRGMHLTYVGGKTDGVWCDVVKMLGHSMVIKLIIC